MEKKLILVSSSFGRSKYPDLLPAFDRYTGVFFRVIKKSIREGFLQNTDILIITEKYGILEPDEMIPYEPPEYKSVHIIDIDKTRQRNLKELLNYFKRREYSEIFVAAGKTYIQLIVEIIPGFVCRIKDRKD